MWTCQVLLGLTQIAFALGAVYYKYMVDTGKGTQDHNPVVFAFVREIVAGSIMCCLAYLSTGMFPKRGDLMRIGYLGTLLYCNQLFYILGVSMSGVVMATCMQPGIPVFTVALAVALKMEYASWRKFVGIGFACLGAFCMVFGGSTNTSSDGGVGAESASRLQKMGNILLLLNVVAMSVYYILVKPLLAVYPPMAVAAWAYIVAAAEMGLTAYLSNHTHPEGWYLPAAVMGPLVYWIFVCSVGGYYIIAWSMTHLPSSQVATFQCLQPFVGTVLAFTLLGERLTWWDLGAVGVVFGLVIVNREGNFAPPSPPRSPLKSGLPTINIRPSTFGPGRVLKKREGVD
ncbi:hypothetical protein BSKO_08240 [Bryopsis sp. KO-2023]|nr:hypothetical protein BSKO_08240 [Bryopsis sp. KO-2023]